jgi:hypothetical protein
MVSLRCDVDEIRAQFAGFQAAQQSIVAANQSIVAANQLIVSDPRVFIAQRPSLANTPA